MADHLLLAAMSGDTKKVIMGAVALVIVLFTLVASIVVPRRDSGFPGRSLRVLVLVMVCLVLGMLVSVELLGTEEEEASAETPPAATTGAEGQAGSTAAATTGASSGQQGDPAAGKEVFASAGCASCHTLEAAGATGTVGPNLDDLKPPYDTVVHQVTDGGAVMPAFKDKLTPAQIQDVAAFVVASTS